MDDFLTFGLADPFRTTISENDPLQAKLMALTLQGEQFQAKIMKKAMFMTYLVNNNEYDQCHDLLFFLIWFSVCAIRI